MDNTQDLKSEELAPDVRYKKYYHDRPKQYCCRAMREGVEDLEFIQYCEDYDEYSFSSYNGYLLTVMSYCPYCGKEIESLKPLFSFTKHHYMKEKEWSLDDVERYWGLYRKGKSQEEAEKIVEQERKSVPAQEKERKKIL